MEKDISYKWNQGAGVAILIPDKIDFKSKPEKRDESYYIMIKSVHQEELIFIHPILEHLNT